MYFLTGSALTATVFTFSWLQLCMYSLSLPEATPRLLRSNVDNTRQDCFVGGGGSHATLHLNKNASVQLSTLSTILTDFIRLNYTLCSDPDASAEHISSVAHIPDRSLIWVLGVKISAFSDPHVISIPWLFEGVLWLSLTDIVTILQVCVCVCCQRWCVSILSCTTYFTFSLLLVSVNVDGDDKQ